MCATPRDPAIQIPDASRYTYLHSKCKLLSFERLENLCNFWELAPGLFSPKPFSLTFNNLFGSFFYIFKKKTR